MIVNPFLQINCSELQIHSPPRCVEAMETKLFMPNTAKLGTYCDVCSMKLQPNTRVSHENGPYFRCERTRPAVVAAKNAGLYGVSAEKPAQPTLMAFKAS